MSDMQVMIAVAPSGAATLLTENVVAKGGPGGVGVVVSSRTDDGTMVTETLPIDHGFEAVINPQLLGYIETGEVIPFAAAIDVDMLTENTKDVTLTGNCAITVVNIPPAGAHGRTTIFITDTPGGSVVTWVTAVNWGAMGAPPVLGAGKTNIVSLVSRGGTLYGTFADDY